MSAASGCTQTGIGIQIRYFMTERELCKTTAALHPATAIALPHNIARVVCLPNSPTREK